MTDTTRVTATTYFDAWRARDFERLRTVLAPEVEFVGVLGTANGADECIAGLRGMAESVMTDLVLHARVVEGADAMTWFDLITATTPPIPTVTLMERSRRRMAMVATTALITTTISAMR